MNQRLKLYTFDNYYGWLWCENWNQGRYWYHALETVNCVCSGKCCRQLIPKCDRSGEVWVFVAVFWCLYVPEWIWICVWFWCQLEFIGLNMVWQLSGVWLCKRIWVCTLCGAPQVGPNSSQTSYLLQSLYCGTCYWHSGLLSVDFFQFEVFAVVCFFFIVIVVITHTHIILASRWHFKMHSICFMNN